MRIVAHDKSSLAPEGKSIAFALHPENGFAWKGYCDVSVDDLLSGNGSAQTKTMQMESELREMLCDGAVAAEEIFKNRRAKVEIHYAHIGAMETAGDSAKTEMERTA